MVCMMKIATHVTSASRFIALANGGMSLFLQKVTTFISPISTTV